MRKLRLLIPSLVVLAFCAVLLAGSTFALFTSQAEASISVTSGKVDIKANLGTPTLYSAKAVETVQTSDDFAGKITTGNYSGQYIFEQQIGENPTFANGGTATVTTTNNISLLKIERMTPGDKVELNLSITNFSNVAIKYRVRLVAPTDDPQAAELSDVLEIKVGDQDASHSYASDWTELAPSADPQPFNVALSFELPLSVNDLYQDLPGQDQSVSYQIVVEAVQANAATSNN